MTPLNLIYLLLGHLRTRTAYVTLSGHHCSLAGEISFWIECLMSSEIPDLPHHPIHLSIYPLILPSDIIHLSGEWFPNCFEPNP
jgi:hypothetical protein